MRTEFADFGAEMRAEVAELRVDIHRLANHMLVSTSAITIAAMGIVVTLARVR